MKLESMELFTVVYSEMLQKISATLEDRDDRCPRDIDNALNYAMKHIYIIPECLGFDPEDYSITLIRDNDGSYQFDVDFDKEAVAAIKFTDEKYTNNIVQNYIKSDVISKPEDGKKRGYTKIHLAQLVLLSYMRPILTTEEIKKVIRLAFNDINDRSDDIISWQDAYKIFAEIQTESFSDFLTAPLFNQEKLEQGNPSRNKTFCRPHLQNSRRRI